ncbi:MAG TPA: corrinoid protein [Candidatus Acidoferrum sp.]|nr:corrinoid protein [Candidatus Acidoferrum sp.]
MTNEKMLESLKEAVVRFDINNIRILAENSLKKGTSAYEAVINGMAKGMEVVGQKYQSGEYFLPELVMAGETFKEGMKVFGPHLKPSEVGAQGRIVIGTVEGDLHDIGKNIVASMIEAAGFEVHDLGVDITAARFVDKAKEVGADVVAMSALLSTTFPHMREVIDAIKKSRINSKTLLGGAPLNTEIAKSIGADGYGKDAVEGANICKQWAAKKN